MIDKNYKVIEHTIKRIMYQMYSEEKIKKDHSKYKQRVVRMLAYEFFCQAIDNGTFTSVVNDALSKARSLPYGWNPIKGSYKKQSKEPTKEPVKEPEGNTVQTSVVEHPKSIRTRKRRK